MEDESLLSIAAAWFLLGLIVGVFIFVKLGAASHVKNPHLLDEPRVTFDRADHRNPKQSK